MKIVRKTITLIELLISIGLALALLTSTLFFYRYVATVDTELMKDEKRALEERLLQYRLTEVFSSVSSKDPSYFQEKGELFGITSGLSLALKVENPPFEDPQFGNTVIMLLFIDAHERLSIATWEYIKDNSNPNPKMQLEILAEKIKEMRFEFLTSAGGENLQVGNWIKEWKKEYGIPAAIKLYLNDKLYAFPVACKAGGRE